MFIPSLAIMSAQIQFHLITYHLQSEKYRLMYARFLETQGRQRTLPDTQRQYPLTTLDILHQFQKMTLGIYHRRFNNRYNMKHQPQMGPMKYLLYLKKFLFTLNLIRKDSKRTTPIRNY